MTPLEFDDFIYKLEDAYQAHGRKFNGRQTWVDVLFGEDFEACCKALKQHNSESDRIPRPANILELAKQHTAPTKHSALEVYRGDCPLTRAELERDFRSPNKPAADRVAAAWLKVISHRIGGMPGIGDNQTDPNKNLDSASKIAERMPLEDAFTIAANHANAIGMRSFLDEQLEGFIS